MRFYYTGAKTYLGIQQIPFLSLGGFISSSLIPNSALNNLFSSITPYTIEKGLDEYALIVLKNELGNDVKNIKISFSYENQDIKVANLEVSAILNTNGNFEQINNSTSAPYFGEFHPALSPTEVCIGNLKKDEYLGIWVKRKIDKIAYKQIFEDSSIIEDKFIEFNRENIKLNMNWVNL